MANILGIKGLTLCLEMELRLLPLDYPLLLCRNHWSQVGVHFEVGRDFPLSF